MPTTVPDVTNGEVITEAWGDAVRLAVTELQTTPPNHGSRHQPGGADALPTAAAGASAVGDTAATGTSTSLARADHRHSREAFGSPTGASTPGQAAADGTATTVARSDHKHQRPDAYGTGSTNVKSTTSTPGVSGSIARADHQHALFGDADGVQAVSGSTGALASGASITVTMTFPTAFSGAPTIAMASVFFSGDIVAPAYFIRAISTTQIQVRVTNNDPSSRTLTVYAVCYRNP